MKAIIPVTVLIVGMMASNLAIAADQIEFIRLKHTVAEEIIPLIKPFLQPNAVITGKNDQLIVRVASSNLDSIRSIIQQIDVPKRQLKISLRQMEHPGERGSDVYASGSIDLDKDANAVLGGDRGPQSDGGRPRPRKNSTQGRENIFYEVRTTEGQPTFLRLGKFVPYKLRRFMVTGRHNSYADNVRYKQVSSGLLIIPRVSGDFVQLEILSQRQRLSEHDTRSIDSTQLRSFVHGRLSAWIRLGATEQEVDNKSLTSKTLSTEKKSGFSVQLKVELVR